MTTNTTVATPTHQEARGVGAARVTLAISSLLAISYVLCVVFDLLFPSLAMYRAWAPLLPGFHWLSWASFTLGLAESFAYGLYIAGLYYGLLWLFARVDGIGRHS